MMYGYGPGAGWMVLMPLLWVGLLAVIVWAVVRLARGPGDRVAGSGQVPPRQESAQEILDRRLALGEIDVDTYTELRARLASQVPESR